MGWVPPIAAVPLVKMLIECGWRNVSRVVGELRVQRYAVLVMPEDSTRRSAVKYRLCCLQRPIPRTQHALREILALLGPECINTSLTPLSKPLIPLKPIPFLASDGTTLHLFQQS